MASAWEAPAQKLSDGGAPGREVGRAGEVGGGWGQGRPIHQTAAVSRLPCHSGPNTRVMALGTAQAQ